MITSLTWEESVRADCVGVWERNGAVLKMVDRPIQRRVWFGLLGLLSIQIIERDMDYLAWVCGSDMNVFSTIFGGKSVDRDAERKFIAPDLESAKRRALEYALGFLKRDLVIVCSELDVPVP